MATPMKNNAMAKMTDEDGLACIIFSDRSVIFNVPVCVYKIPIAIKMKTAPMLPIKRYCIAANTDFL